MNKNTNLIELFIELNDQIYFEGYTSSMAMEDPAKYEFELAEFMSNYIEPKIKRISNYQTPIKTVSNQFQLFSN